MPRYNHPVSEETERLHRIVEHGGLDELRTALADGLPVNAHGHIGATSLMVAAAARDLQKMKLLIEHGADPELTDDFNGTALRRAVEADFVDGVRFLLSLGVDRGYRPKYPLKKIDYDVPMRDIELPEELRHVMTQAEWRASMEETRASMREMGQNPAIEPVISDVLSVAVLNLLVEAGDDLNLAPTEVKRALVGLREDDTFRATPTEYRAQKSPRYGTANPQRMELTFWEDMIRIGGNAYSARQHFHDTNAFDGVGPVWCYDRFGSTLTPLSDGRFVQVGGEHEDHYDPDFHIYNDVVVHDGDGGFQIYGYPKDVFPPTDFHSATLTNDGIYIIGCLGYSDQRREGFTPVYRLKVNTWEIEAMDTAGQMPGWIHRHCARYVPERNSVLITGGEVLTADASGDPELVANSSRFELCLASLQWRKREEPSRS